MKPATMLWLAVAALVAFTTAPAAAKASERGSAAEEQRIAFCIHRSARGKPWLEKTLWGLRDQEGGWVGAEVRNRDGSHDLGPMQVNSLWLPHFARLVRSTPHQLRRWLRDDPCFNVEAARWLILNALADTAGYWKAIGTYHSHERARQAHYMAAVARRLERRFGGSVSVQTP